MMKKSILLVMISALPLAQAASGNPAVDTLLDQYRAAGAASFTAEAGQHLWNKKHQHTVAPLERSCNLCHTSNLTRNGQHAKTQKRIKPMAPGINTKRLTDTRKIEKWFMRNCKWTLGRECSPQEKGDFLLYTLQ